MNTVDIPGETGEPSNLKNSERAKLLAVAYMLEELRVLASTKTNLETFWLTLGYIEGTVQRMLYSKEGNEFDWLGNVTERVEKYKKVSQSTSPRIKVSDLLEGTSFETMFGKRTGLI